MLHRRYADGVVLFDPLDGITYFLTGDSLEIVDLILEFITEGTTEADDLLSRALDELEANPAAYLPGSEASENLKRWIQLALRMQQQ